MQNKPNFRKAKMNENLFVTKDYENKPCLRAPAKQTQSNPISSPIHAQTNPIKPNFKREYLLIDRLKPKFLNFHLKDSLTGGPNPLKYWFSMVR